MDVLTIIIPMAAQIPSIAMIISSFVNVHESSTCLLCLSFNVS
jgi:hypothetical protein